jgi:hypothetical protein
VFWLGVALVLTCLFAAASGFVLRLEQGFGTPAGTTAVQFVAVIVLSPIAIGMMWVQLRHFRGLWDRVSSGARIERSSLATPPEREIRLWQETHAAGDWGPTTEGSQRSDLVRALTLLRFGEALGRWARRLVLVLFFVLLFLGLLAVVVLAFFVGSLDPRFPGFTLTLAVGPVVVILLSFWFFHRADRELGEMDNEFSPLVGAGDRLEQSFWARF